MEYLLKQISDTLNAAQAHYQIWFTLRGEKGVLPKYKDKINDPIFMDFFNATSAAHYKIMLIELGRLFDKNNKSASLKKLEKKLKSKSYNVLSKSIEKIFTEYETPVKNILTIRSEVIAHKKIDTNSINIHKNNPIKPNEIRDILNKISKLLNKIQKELGVTNHQTTYNDKHRKATFSLVKALR